MQASVEKTGLIVVQTGEVTVVHFPTGKLIDDKVIELVGDELARRCGAHADGRKVLLSLAGVEYVSSAFLGKLVRCLKEASAAGKSVRLCEATPRVLEVLKLTRLIDLFGTVYETREKALEGW